MALYLVTGGAGFIGSNIVHELLARGERVRVMDNFSTGRRSNLSDVLKDIELFPGDLRDLNACYCAVRGVDYVLHQGAIPSVQRSVDDPATTNDANITGTLNILIAARGTQVKRLVYASSSAIYGDSPSLPKREDLPPNPKSPYAVSKLAAEYYCRTFTEIYGLETVSLRYFNVFGPRQDPASHYAAVIPLFIKAMLAGRQPVIYGDGLQSRDFTYVANNVQANLLAATADGVAGEVFNIACGQRYNLLELVAALNDILGTDIEPTFAPPRPGDVTHSLADISRAQDRLGYSVAVDFRTGLEKTVEWYRRVEEH
ncbi:MAG TPA: SDR family oxidoreductase [Anaerolineae bacterium]|nr:SDR family oxidoreductase [Anaerolineae bacterium]